MNFNTNNEISKTAQIISAIGGAAASIISAIGIVAFFCGKDVLPWYKRK